MIYANKALDIPLWLIVGVTQRVHPAIIAVDHNTPIISHLVDAVSTMGYYTFIENTRSYRVALNESLIHFAPLFSAPYTKSCHLSDDYFKDAIDNAEVDIIKLTDYRFWLRYDNPRIINSAPPLNPYPVLQSTERNQMLRRAISTYFVNLVILVIRDELRDEYQSTWTNHTVPPKRRSLT